MAVIDLVYLRADGLLGFRVRQGGWWKWFRVMEDGSPRPADVEELERGRVLRLRRAAGRFEMVEVQRSLFQVFGRVARRCSYAVADLL